ncbi:hypothetical protein [Polyangium sp. 15x6]|uniref:hypothetical protein n=1 Tax=Polyangium sp. 15x6 TaxID=3042687 RepID=UPI00249BEFDE|nr:hypothetical protein [Polyangium sp. 15x6]MDI3286659.1 hypothetical protein [Polyangium sp. 15x6]
MSRRFRHGGLLRHAGNRDAARRGFVDAAQLRGNGEAWKAVANLCAVDGLDDVARVAEELGSTQK